MGLVKTTVSGAVAVGCLALVALGAACGSAGGGGGGIGAGASGPGVTSGPITTGPGTTGPGTTGPGTSGSSSSGQPICTPSCAANESCVGGACVPNVGGPCTSDSDCDSAQCNGGGGSQCLDWHDGNGFVCSCDCSWGTDCDSGCCRIPSGSSTGSCGPATSCAAIDATCTDNEQCLNNVCDGFKTYCYSGNGSSTATCGCGCASNADCESGCCAPYTLGDSTIYACSAPGTPGC